MSQLTWITIPLTTTFFDVPSTPGVYQFMKNTTPIYIGKSVNLKARLRSHYQNTKLDQKELAIWKNSHSIRYTTTDNDFLAILLESELIKKYQPPYNIITKDDKSYLYILIDLHDLYPKPRLVRARDLPNTKKSIHTFGPFPSRQIAEEILYAIRHLIPFCQSKQLGKRVCFYSHLGLCSPCPSQICEVQNLTDRQMLTKQYRRQIFQIIKILSGKTEPIIKELTLQMKSYGKDENFEKALELKAKLENFQHWIDTHSFSKTRVLNFNQSEESLTSLEKLLGVRPLSRIECYDASNLTSGIDTASLVVLTDGQIDKSQYRRFKIKNLRANSDFSRLEEALTRRFRNSWPMPNLIVLDGGKPQVRMAERVLDQLPNPPHLIGLAKNPDRLVIPTPTVPNFLAPSSEPLRPAFITIHPPLNHPGFNLLKLLRDESHRFANSYRRILQNKSMYN